MNVFVTRPQPQGDETVSALRLLGIEAYSLPVITCTPLAQARELSHELCAQHDAVILTSGVALRILHAHGMPADMPLYTPSSVLEARARALGYRHVTPATGDASGMLPVLQRAHATGEFRCPAYARAQHVTLDLAAALRPYGCEIAQYVLYRSEPVHTLPTATACRLHEEPSCVVVFYSAFTAATFTALMQREGINTAPMHAVCLSDAIASSLEHSLWRNITICGSAAEMEVAQAIRSCIAAGQ